MKGAGKQEQRSQMPAVWAIALAVCGGGSVMVLGPMKERLAMAQAELDAVQAVAARSGELMAGEPVIARASARVEHEIAAVEDAASGLSDPTALVSRLNDLARGAGVQVNRVSPRMLDAQKSSSGAIKPSALVATTIQASGNFPAITAFLWSLERQRLMGNVQSVRLVPTTGRGAAELNATIEMMHASFRMPSEETMAAIVMATPDGEGGGR